MSNRFGGTAAFRSAILVTGATYISYAVGLLVSMVIARDLGPRDFGHYSYLVWLSGTLTMLLGNGLTQTAIRFVSESLGRDDTAEASHVQHLLATWFTYSIVFVTVLYAAGYHWLQPSGWDKPEWMFAGAALVSAAAKSDYIFGTSVSKGHGHFEIDARTINLMSLANLLGVIVMAAIGVPVEAYIVYFVALCIGHALVTRTLMGRVGIRASRGDIDPMLQSRIRSHYLWTALLFVLYALSNKSVENVFLNAYVGPEAVGWFAIAASITRGGVEMLTTGLNTVLLPMMSHAYGSNDTERAHRILTDAIRYYFFLGITLAGVGVLWAAPTVSLLYGEAYAPAILGLRVMMLIGGLVMPEGAISSLLVTTDRQSLRVVLAGAGLLLTVVGAAILVPAYGFEGALAAHAVTRLAIFAASVVLIMRLFDISMPIAGFLNTIGTAALGAALAAGILTTSSSLLAQFIAGAVYGFVCVAGSFLLRVWTAGDLQVLSEVAARIPKLHTIFGLIVRYARVR